ncbi:MAG: T9SS type A sorting domain-containing protein [Cyclobacteriaceae bacterium]|nr:T9SS type A sorting domain-containing protein [Cyclobacteriaceae bacterium]
MIRLLLVAICLTSFTLVSQAQAIQSNGTGGGNWSDPDTWQGGIVPDFNNGTITILTDDYVNVDGDYTIDQATVQNGATLYVDPGAVLTINNGASTDIIVIGQLYVEGELILTHGSTHAGMTPANTFFLEGSIYRHRFTTAQGVIPLANWDPDSQVIIEGYTSFSAGSEAGNWDQDFGNFTWNCLNQTSTVQLNGFLTSIAGNFEVNTGTGILQLSTTQSPTIEIGGDLIVTSTSRLRFSTTGANTVVNIAGNFENYATSAATGGSRFTTTGNCTVNVAGDFIMDAPGGQLQLTSAAGGTGTLNVGGDFNLIDGALVKTGNATAQGYIVFEGTDIVHTFNNTGSIAGSAIHYVIPESNTLIVLGESTLSASGSSSITVDGTLVVQSENPTGAIVNGTGNGIGNVRVTNANRFYNPGSVIIYAGSGPQFMGNGQPTAADVTTIINNPDGVTQAVTTLVLNGNLTLENGNLTIPNNNLTVNGTTEIQLGNILFSTVSTARTLTLNGEVVLGDEIVVTSGTSNANVILGGDISGGSTISFSGANSNLTINGSGDLDFPIPGPTTLETLTINRGDDGIVVFNEDLTVTATASVTVNAGAIRMNGTLNTGRLNLATGTTLYFEGQTLELRNQFNNTLSGGVLSADAGSVLNVINTGTLGTLAFSPTGNTLGTFFINRPTGGTLVTLNSPLTVENEFTLRDGNFLNTSGLSFGNDAVVTRYNTANFAAGSVAPTGGSYHLFYEEGGATPANMTTGVETLGLLANFTSNYPRTVTIAAGSSVNITESLNVNSGTVTVGAGGSVDIAESLTVIGTFNCGTNNAISANTLEIDDAGIFNTQTSTVTLIGDMINNGTFNRNTGTFVFAGNSTIGGANNPLFRNIVIDGVLTPPADTLNVYGNFTNNGIFNNSGTGTVAFRTVTNLPQVVSGSSVTNFHNIFVGNTTGAPDVIVESNQNMTGVLTLASSATFDADGAADNRTFTLISSSDDPTQDAAIAPFPNAAAQVQGSVTVQRFMSLEGPNDRIYRYISSPVQNATVADIQNEIPVSGTFTGASVCSGCTSNPSMFRYDETLITGGIDDGYVAFPVSSNAEQLATGRGYTTFIRGNIEPFLSVGSALWDVRGPVNRGSINYGVTFTSSGVPANDGWNLVGNPYPSTIDWDAPTGWTRANVSGTIYMLDNVTGQYATYTSGTGGTNGGSRYIAMGQGFWIQTTGASPNMASNEPVKAAGTQTTFFRERSEYNILKFALSNGTLRDEAIIHFRDDATDGFDAHSDAWKLSNATINLSSVVEGVGKLAVNSMGDFNCAKIIKLDVSGVTPGNYEFDFTSVETFESYIGLALIDNFAGEEIDLRNQSSYAFQVTSDALSYGDERFAIRFSGAEVRNDFVLEANNELCSDTDLKVTITGSQPDVTYQVFKGSVGISSGVMGNGETIEVIVPSSALVPGASNLTLKGSLPGCTVQQTMLVTMVETIEVVDASGAERCLTGGVELSVANTVGKVLWYDAEDVLTPIAEGAVFQTPELTASKSYYAAVSNSLGCEGERVPVQAIIHQYEPASIHQEGNTLVSNYETGNQWLLNGIEIPGATSQYYDAEDSGLYTLVVSTIGGCVTDSNVQFVFTSTENLADKTIRVYPNPTRGRLLIEVDTPQQAVIKAVDVTGREHVKVVLEGSGPVKSGEVDLTNSSDGIYILHIQKGDLVHQVKIIKTTK